MRGTGEAVAVGLVCLLLAAPSARATEYFVAKHGADAADGLSEKTAFATVGKGMNLLKPGDTLTILPGDYFEAVSARLSGRPGAAITIRAKRPGSAVLRGDVDVRGFRRAQGTRYTYAVAFDRRVEGVADRANLRLYEPKLSIAEVDRTLGAFYQDPKTKRLYVHTADSSPADCNALSVSVTNGFGLLLTRPPRSKTVHDVVIDGLAFTGYQARDFPSGPGSRSRWGLHVVYGERVVVRRCTAFLNSGGIYLLVPSDCVVEDCYAFANFGRFLGLGGNILGWSGHRTTFRRNVVEGFWDLPVSAADITFYGGRRADKKAPGGLMADNLAVNAGLMIKGAFAFGERSFQRRNCVVGRDAYFFKPPDASNLFLPSYESAGALRSFVDPIRHDYRLQSDAPRRGKGPKGSDPGPFPYRDEVFFVSPTGDDAKAGTSLALAWRNLARAGRAAKAGQTVYVTEGVYRESLVPVNSGAPDKPIRFLRRGRDKVVLDGEGRLPVGIDLAGRARVHVRGFLIRNFTGAGVRAKGGEGHRIEESLITNCGGAGVDASGTKGLVLCRDLLRDNKGGGLRLENSPGASLRGNIFDRNGGPGIRCDRASMGGLYSDRNAFPPSARPSAAVAGRASPTLDVWRKASGQDPRSVAVEPGYRDADGGDFSLRPDSPLIGRGPLARPIGPYLRTPVKTPPRVEGLAAHAVTARTATLECWTPTVEAAVTFEWGDTPERKNKIEAGPAVFHSIGLTGLKPGGRYFFSAKASGDIEQYRWAPCAVKAPAEGPTSAAVGFETPARDGPARTFHVAVTGNDANSGLSKAQAWRTVTHAAGRVRAGDTVLIHEGTYEEFVLARATGEKGAPITFRAAPGETVWMEGSDRSRSTAFRIEDKHHIHVDGLHFRHFRNRAHAGGCVSIQGGSNHVVRRCFYDGRERRGYVTDFLRATRTNTLLVENCVMINGMGTGMTLIRCYDSTVRHCVFYNNSIRAVDVYHWRLEWDPKTLATFSHNLLCANLPHKTGNPLFRFSHLDSLRSDHNGYFTRKGPAERGVVQACNYRGKKLGALGRGEWTRGEKLLLKDVQERSGQERGSIFGNPGIRAVKKLVPSGARRGDWKKVEMHWDGKQFEPLDFKDFFADPNGPFARSAVGKPIGLDPAAFR